MASDPLLLQVRGHATLLPTGSRTPEAHFVSTSPQLTPLLFAAALSLLLIALPQASPASERGVILVLAANSTDTTCIVSSYGAGFVVGVEPGRDAAYAVTARHVVHGFNRVFVLYDPTAFPFDYIKELESGSIPPVLANTLVDLGHPRPTRVRSGRIADCTDPGERESLILQTESWILRGAEREYLALPREDRLDLFHLLPAEVAKESSEVLDIALLTISEFPRSARDPVLYMSTPDSIPTGTRVTTFGCRCGLTDGIAQAEVSGTAVRSGQGFLSYESGLVSPGFSGGPVIAGDHVVAMNLTQDLPTGSRIRARLASDFRDLVDSWVGLRRMEVDLTIDSPEGARDGVVSTNQDFIIKASARLDPGGELLAPIAYVYLDLPDPYRWSGVPDDVLAVGDERQWTMSSPPQVTGALTMRIHGSDTPSASDSIPLDEVVISTEEGITLTGEMVEGPRSGDVLFLGHDFPVAVKFERSGQPLTDSAGKVAIDFVEQELEITDGLPSREISTEAPVVWRLRTGGESVGTTISFKADLQDLDRNGRPLLVELPKPVTIRVVERPGFRFYSGIGRLSLEGTDGNSGEQGALGRRSEGETKGEMEFGAKFRVGNAMQRGIPLHLTLALGFGIDDTWEKEASDESGPLQSLIVDWRAWGGLGLSAGLGRAEFCLDAGYIRFERYVGSGIPDELEARYAVESVGRGFIRPGIELRLASTLSVYAGARVMPGQDDTEYYLQLRVVNGF